MGVGKEGGAARGCRSAQCCTLPALSRGLEVSFWSARWSDPPEQYSRMAYVCAGPVCSCRIGVGTEGRRDMACDDAGASTGQVPESREYDP